MTLINTSLSSAQAIKGISQDSAASAATGSANVFSDVLGRAMADVATSEQTVSTESLKLLTGDSANIHNVVLAAEKAEVALRLTLQVRNKVLDAYNEIMRMQI